MTLRGAYVDENGVRWDTNDADFEGVLTKKSKWMGEWRQRYLILKGSKLFFSKSSNAAPHGMIDLVDCLSVKNADAKCSKQNSLEIVLKNDRFYLVAKSDKERDDWTGQISRAIIKHSSLYVRDDDDDNNNDDSLQNKNKLYQIEK